MTDATPDQITGGAADTDRLARLRAGLKRRHARETRFKWYGRLAIGAAMVFLAILLIRIVEQGHTAFYAHTVTIPVYMDPARIDRAYPQGSNFEQLAAVFAADARFAPIAPFVPAADEQTDFELYFAGRKEIHRLSVRKA